jgi:hypothetical protein
MKNPVTIKVELTEEALSVLMPEIYGLITAAEEAGKTPIVIQIRPPLKATLYGIPLI